MRLDRTENPIDRTERNKINRNWDKIESDFNNVVSNVSEQAFEQVVDAAKLIWKTPVDEFSDIVTTYPNPEEGWAVQTLDDGKVYRYTNGVWEWTQQIDAGPVNALETRLEKVEVNPSMTTNEDGEQASIGNELLTAAGWTSAGWTGDFVVGFTHIAGQTQPLRVTVPSLEPEKYLVTIVATDLEPTGNSGASDFYISLGGSTTFETYKGTHAELTLSFGIKAATTNNDLVITPRSGWTGAIKSISLKKIVSGSEPSMHISNSDGVSMIEMRGTKSLVRNTDLNSIFMGKASGLFNIDGDGNYAYGDYSLANITTGFWNCAMGLNALRDATVASRNIASGFMSQAENETGDRNVSSGTFSLSRLKSGRNNVAMGADAGWKLVDGNENIMLGTLALGEAVSASRNFAAGYDALGNSANTGNDNIAIGRDAARDTQGNDNIAMGNSSMYRNETGSDNIVFGRNTFLWSKEGSYNIVAGRGAVAQNRNSNHNVALGFAALGQGLAGEDNVAIGKNTLTESETNNNVAIGPNSLNLNHSSFDNVGIGQNTLRGITAGDGNTAIGSGAMGSTNAGKTLRNMQRNVAIGKNSGFNLANGALYNTILGSSAGFTLANGVNNILIGYNVDVATASTSNTLNIGNTIRGNLQTGLVEMKGIRLTELPTALPGTPNIVWNDGGTLRITS